MKQVEARCLFSSEKKQRYKDAFHNRTQGGLWQVWSSFREIQHITETLNHVENGPISLWLL